jgi:hypothetical protein
LDDLRDDEDIVDERADYEEQVEHRKPTSVRHYRTFGLERRRKQRLSEIYKMRKVGIKFSNFFLEMNHSAPLRQIKSVMRR